MSDKVETPGLIKRRAILIRLIGLLKPHRALVTGTLALLGLHSLIKLAAPWLIKIIFDDVLGAGRQDLINPIFGTLFLIAALATVTGFAHTFLSLTFAAKLLTGLSSDVYCRIQSLSLRDVQEIKAGELLNATLNDPISVSSGLFSLIYTLAKSCVILLFSLAALFYLDWRMTLILLGFLGAYGLLYWSWLRNLREGYRSIREQTSTLNGRVQEAIRDFAVIKAYGKEKRESLNFIRKAHKMLRTRLSVHRLHSRYFAANELFVYLGLITILWYGLGQISLGRITVGGLIAFYGYLLLVIGPVSGLAGLFTSLQQTVISAERIFAIFDRVPSVGESPKAFIPGKIEGRITFKNVLFEFENDSSSTPGDKSRIAALRDVSLKINPGETVALVGPTGSGKTTLAYLAARLYDPTDGVIEFDGHDLKEIKLSWFHSHIAIVTQETLLFEGTIAENISFARTNASRGEVVVAARAAGLEEFVSGLETDYDTPIGEGGLRLSGGQRQLVAIARAFLAKPKIIILDEPTSALDAYSEERFRAGLRKLSQGCTTIIIAHRLTTAIEADRIVYLEAGEIAEEGSHRELLERRGKYAALFNKQKEQLLD